MPRFSRREPMAPFRCAWCVMRRELSFPNFAGHSTNQTFAGRNQSRRILRKFRQLDSKGSKAALRVCQSRPFLGKLRQLDSKGLKAALRVCKAAWTIPWELSHEH